MSNMQKVVGHACGFEEFGERFVGDPIDVATGAFVDDVRDFALAGGVPLEFRRTYSSERNTQDRGLGRGWVHNFDHGLVRGLDGMVYIPPRGEKITFSTVGARTHRVVRDGYVLAYEQRGFVVTRPDATVLIFENVRAKRLRVLHVCSDDGILEVRYNPFDPLGRLSSITDRHGKKVLFAWDDKHIVRAYVESADRSEANLARYFYEDDLLVEVEDAYKHRVKYAYDSAGRLTKKTDRKGYSFLFEYDKEGRCVHSAGEDGVLEVTLEYSPYHTRVTRGDGGVWEYRYNDSKSLTEVVDAEGFKRSYVMRPEDGQIAFEIDGAKNKIDCEYDAKGALIGRRDELGRPIAREQEHAVPTTPAEYELGRFMRPTETFPEAADLQLRVPADIAAKLTVAQGTNDGDITRFVDAQGLLIREERGGYTRRYAYDPNGNLRWKTDFDGGKTEYEYSSFNHLITKTDPNGYQTSFTYTKQDTLHAVVDARWTRTEFLRDLRGDVKGISRFEALKEKYKRDGAGRLIEKTDAEGRKLYEIKRGPQGEVLERAFASGGFERFEYNEDLQVVSAETASSKCTFAYDWFGRRTEDLREGKGVQRRFFRDALTEYRVLDKFVTRYRYTETTYCRDVTITDPTGLSHCIRDHGYGVVTREYASGRKETTQYHPEGHVLARHVYGTKGHNVYASSGYNINASATNNAWVRKYEYSGEGYLVARHDSFMGTTRYEHDAGHRLTEEQGPDGSRWEYWHDSAGNLMRNGAACSAQYDNNLLMEANGRKFDYDYRQAIRSESWQNGRRRFHRDERDQLVLVDSFQLQGDKWVPNPYWTAKYDALNRRMEKNFYGETTTFYWDTDRLAAEVLSDGMLRVYIYADALAMTPVLFVDYAHVDDDPESGTVYAVFADHLGCPERIEDMAGEVVWAAKIAPYGAAQVLEGRDFHQPLRWPGHYYDRELKLQYNRFRTYSPELGRYYEPDPLGRGGGIENVYAYTRNPLYRVDTHGLGCPDGGDDADGKSKKEGKPDTETPAPEGSKSV
jgi:RHS repeat-associated protein